MSPAPDRRKKMKQISVRVPQEHIETIDELVRKGVFPSRNEAVREAIRKLLRDYGYG